MERQALTEEKKRTLIVGCGNPSRSDDSVGLYIVNEVNRRLGRPLLGSEVAFYGLDGDGNDDGSIATVFVQQLGPELVDVVKDYDEVIFVDAHTGSYAEDLRFATVSPSYVASAFSHHLEPSAIMALSKMLYDREPRGFALSVRGYDFQFGTKLSERTIELADQAVERVMHVLDGSVRLPEVRQVSVGVSPRHACNAHEASTL